LKGYDLSISAFAHFISELDKHERENCELLIVGSGPEKTFYQDLVKAKGIEKQVAFIDWMDRQDLMALLQDASAFVFPSHEGAGMIVAEALSFGVPVICLDNCGPGEFIDKDCGIGVPEQDYDGTVKALSNGISTLYHDAGLWSSMSEGARRRFETHFDWSRRGEALQNIYQAI
jgi:glycosyltransferase involved in cell wall biosynthesis